MPRNKLTPASAQQTQQSLQKGIISVKAVDMLRHPRPGVERQNQTYTAEPFVPWFDSNNCFPLDVNERSRVSTTHSRILQDKITYTCGHGFVVDNNGQDDSALRDYLDNCNACGETAEDVLERIVTDSYTYGNAFLYIVKNGSFVALDHKDATFCRVSKDKKHVYYSRGFNRNNEYRYNKDFEPVAIPLYPNFEKVPGGQGQHAIIHIRKYSPEYYYYGQIDYYAAYYSGWLDIDYHIPKYNLGRFENQFRPSGMLVMVGSNTTEEEAKKIEAEVRKNYVGEGRNGKLLLFTVNDPDMAPKFVSFDDAPQSAFGDLQAIANENIILAHRWHPSLVVQQPGKLSNASDIEAAFEQVMNTVIRQEQKRFARLFSRVLKNELGLPFGKLEIETCPPVSIQSRLDPKQILTLDEQRAYFNAPPMEDGSGSQPPKAGTHLTLNQHG